MSQGLSFFLGSALTFCRIGTDHGFDSKVWLLLKNARSDREKESVRRAKYNPG